MTENHVLPEELREIFKQIALSLVDGSETEGGTIFLRDIESALKKGEITSDSFGDNYPNIINGIKTYIAILFLYDVAKSKLLINIEMPRYKRGSDGYLEPPTTLEHLENLVKMFRLVENRAL